MGDCFGLYVHVPFCKSKCPYCDFYSVVDCGQSAGYLDDLEIEMQLCPRYPGAFDSLYVGGGTPSVLASRVLVRLLDKLRARFFADTPAENIEISLEINPSDVDDRLLDALQEARVNRLSLGVQSFDNDVLSRLGRRHDGRGAITGIEAIRKAGFASLGLDLMYNLPGSKPDAWRRTLEMALSHAPEHLSCYALTISPHTRFGRMQLDGRLAKPREDQCADEYMLACRLCADFGYDHYEVSNFARNRHHRSRHNQKYWQRIPSLGLGPAAHSFDGRRRFWNPANLQIYRNRIRESRYPRSGIESIDSDQARIETVALGLRTSRGVALDLLKTMSGFSEKLAKKLTQEGLADVDGDLWRPTERGMLVADGIAKLFL